jgi:hypothetical protein
MSTVKCSLKDLAKTLEKELQKDIKQTKFAASKALNNVAFKARTNLITSYQHNFVVRNTNLPKATAVKKATKENLVAEIEFPKDWMYINTVGGDKKSEKSKVLMVPIKGGDLKDFRTSSGKIKQGQRPASLLKYHNAHPEKKRQNVANPKAFLMESQKTGQTLIARRNKDNRKQMDWLYVGVPVANVKKKWDFNTIVEKTADRNLFKEFEKEFQKAMETAK